MLLYRHGNEAAFEELYHRRVHGLLAYLHRLTGDRHVAEELLQDSFVRAARAAGSWEPQAQVSTWLYRIASNRFRSWRRKRRQVLLPFPSEIRDPGKGPFDETAERDLQRELHRHLATLPANLATAFTLTQLEGLAYAEAAEVLELPEGTVKTHVHRARERLRLRLTRSFAGTTTPLPGKETACPR